MDFIGYICRLWAEINTPRSMEMSPMMELPLMLLIIEMEMEMEMEPMPPMMMELEMRAPHMYE